MSWFTFRGVIGRVRSGDSCWWTCVRWRWWCPRIFGDHAADRVDGSGWNLVVRVGVVTWGRDWSRCWLLVFWCPSIWGDQGERNIEAVVVSRVRLGVFGGWDVVSGPWCR